MAAAVATRCPRPTAGDDDTEAAPAERRANDLRPQAQDVAERPNLGRPDLERAKALDAEDEHTAVLGGGRDPLHRGSRRAGGHAGEEDRGEGGGGEEPGPRGVNPVLHEG